MANAFGELTDTAVQRARFEADMARKARLYGEAYPIDEAFLEALGHMPQASGAALGQREEGLAEFPETACLRARLGNCRPRRGIWTS